MNLFSFIFNIAGANLRHSHIEIAYWTWLEKIFISPAQHQLHHSIENKHFNKIMVLCWQSGIGVLDPFISQKRGKIKIWFTIDGGKCNEYYKYISGLYRHLSITNKEYEKAYIAIAIFSSFKLLMRRIRED